MRKTTPRRKRSLSRHPPAISKYYDSNICLHQIQDTFESFFCRCRKSHLITRWLKYVLICHPDNDSLSSISSCNQNVNQKALTFSHFDSIIKVHRVILYVYRLEVLLCGVSLLMIGRFLQKRRNRLMQTQRRSNIQPA
mgnify:CR=1 FL=1